MTDSNPPCPADLHGSEVAGNGLGLLYRRQDECALLHACQRETCAIAGRWPARRPPDEDAAWRLFAFIAVAHGGPREGSK